MPDRATATTESPDTIHTLLDRLKTDACPVYLRGGQAEREYLLWLVAEQCPLCRAVTVAQRRELALLVAALKLPWIADAYPARSRSLRRSRTGADGR